MTITLNLVPDLEARLRRRAAREGGNEQEVALRLLTNTLAEDDGEEDVPVGGSMADLFAGRLGLVAGSGEAYSEGGGRRFAEHLARGRGQA